MHLLGGRTPMAWLFHRDEEAVWDVQRLWSPRHHPSLCEEVMARELATTRFLTRVSLLAVLLSSFLLCGIKRWACHLPLADGNVLSLEHKGWSEG